MTLTMTELMRCLRNAFVTGAAEGSWHLEGGALVPDAAQEEAALLTDGWVALDGLGAFELRGGKLDGLKDTDWSGTVYLLDPPADVLRLLEDVNAWLSEQGGSAGASVTRRRESFGAYATETAYATGSGSGSWESVFAARLRPWRRMLMEVRV